MESCPLSRSQNESKPSKLSIIFASFSRLRELPRRFLLKIRGVIFRGLYVDFLSRHGLWSNSSEAPFSLVEIGSGSGDKLKAMHEGLTPQNDVLGIDIDHERLRCSRAKCPNIPVVCAQAQEIPLPNEVSDVAVFCHVLHHLNSRDLSLALSEAARIVPRGGKMVVLDTFRPESTVSSWIFDHVLLPVYKNTLGKYEYHNQTKNELIALASEFGFTLISTMKQEESWKRFLISDTLIFVRS